MPISFDHMLNGRRFNAHMYKEENVYQDRGIEDYIPNNPNYLYLNQGDAQTMVQAGYNVHEFDIMYFGVYNIYIYIHLYTYVK